MIDHVLGRPSSQFRKVQVFAVVSFWSLYLLRGNNHGPPVIRNLSQRLSRRFTPWQSVVITLLWLYVCRNFAKIVGLESPEPLANLYSRSFFRATWITTALDAGFWTAMRIKNKRARDIASIICTIYYLIAAEQADEKVRKVRAVLTVDHLRTAWNKPTTPYLFYITSLMRPNFTKYKPRRLRIPRPKSSAYREPVNAWMYFDGPLSDLENQTNLVLDIPGGGFVAMDPRTSDDKLLAWAGKTGVPILSLDYRKAPEYPYPYALNECFDVYCQIIATRGRCVGMKPQTCPRIIITGDSAGGNLATGTTLMIIQANTSPSGNRGVQLPSPAALILLYPALDMNIGSWMTDDQMNLIRAPNTAKRHSNFIKRKSEDIDRRYTPGTPRPSDEDPDHDFFAPRPLKTEDTDVEAQQQAIASSKPQPLRTRLAVSSIISYFSDRIITPEMMRAMIILYVGPHARPDFTTDHLLCPAVAPENLLEHFPKTYFLTGERDPLVDDTVIFAGRLRQAKLRLWKERKEMGLIKGREQWDEREHVEVVLLQGVSHGFITFVSVFPEGWGYVYRCAGWIKDVFNGAPSPQEGPSLERRAREGSLAGGTAVAAVSEFRSANGHRNVDSHHDKHSHQQQLQRQLRRHQRTLTGGSTEDEDAPLAMSSIRPSNNGKSSSPNKNYANGGVGSASQYPTTAMDGDHALRQNRDGDEDRDGDRDGSMSPEHDRSSGGGGGGGGINSERRGRGGGRGGRGGDGGGGGGMSRTKSMVSLGSEEDLLKRRMKGLTMGLSGVSEG